MNLLASVFESEVDERLIGAVIVAVSAALALAVAFLGRGRLPRPLSVALLGVAGAGIGLGGGFLSVHRDAFPDRAQWMAATVLLAVLTPLHVRVVLGPLGRTR